jgi:hypothetical protein
VASQERYV